MVTTVTSLGRSGLHDWFIQRLSALVMAGYALFIVFFIATTPELTHQAWVALFQQPVFKTISIITLILLSLHLWVGLWIVFTDYVKPIAIRFFLQALVICFCLFIILWGIQILWSV